MRKSWTYVKMHRTYRPLMRKAWEKKKQKKMPWSKKMYGNNEDHANLSEPIENLWKACEKYWHMSEPEENLWKSWENHDNLL